MFERLNRSIPSPELGSWIPLEGPLTRTILRLSDGGAFGMFALGGVPCETADMALLAERLARFNDTLRNMAGADRIVLTTYVCRGMADPGVVPAPSPNL